MKTQAGTTPPNQSVALIAPQFNNLDLVSYYRRQVLSDTPGLIGPAASGADTFLTNYLQFIQECPEFVRHFELNHDTAIISVQTSFVQKLFTTMQHEDSANDECADAITESDSHLPLLFQHGMITDAAHKFFKVGKLLQTTCYFEVLRRWQPILISWIGKQNKETYSSHFFTLFISIAEQLSAIDYDYFRLPVFQSIVSTVVDFSDAQRLGFQIAYQKFLTSTDHGLRLQIREWERSEIEYRFVEAEEHYAIAGILLKGCLYHWNESVKRIIENRHVIPKERQDEFKSYITKLFTAATIDAFNVIVNTIRTEFPNTRNWIDWWIKNEHAQMLFPILQIRELKHVQGIHRLMI